MRQWISESLGLPNQNVLGILFGNVGGGNADPILFWSKFGNIFVCNGTTLSGVIRAMKIGVSIANRFAQIMLRIARAIKVLHTLETVNGTKG